MLTNGSAAEVWFQNKQLILVGKSNQSYHIAPELANWIQYVFLTKTSCDFISSWSVARDFFVIKGKGKVVYSVPWPRPLSAAGPRPCPLFAAGPWPRPLSAAGRLPADFLSCCSRFVPPGTLHAAPAASGPCELAADASGSSAEFWHVDVVPI